MKKKLYYVVDIELQDIGDVKESTGNKTINVYEIDNSKGINDIKLNELTSIECSLSDNSKAEIKYYLNANGMGDEEFELIQL